MNEKKMKQILGRHNTGKKAIENEVRKWMDEHDKMVARYARLQERADGLVEALELADHFLDGMLCGTYDETNKNDLDTLIKVYKKVSDARRKWEK